LESRLYMLRCYRTGENGLVNHELSCHTAERSARIVANRDIRRCSSHIRTESGYTEFAPLALEAAMGKEKAEALELIQKLPDEITTDDILEELFFKRMIDRGLQDVDEGRVISHQELKERIAKWRKSAGR